MENEILELYHNDFGIAFKWAQRSKHTKNKVQIVFRDMGFFLTKSEIKRFYSCICQAKNRGSCSCCPHDCNSRNILLKTPSSKVDIAVNPTELKQVEDLIKGTLFQLDLEHYLKDLSKN